MLRRNRLEHSHSLLQIINISVGFFGIQFGWALQMSNTSAIYEYLCANPEQIPLLWLAAPVSGLIAQPLVGYASDHTWTPLGRRRPYLLVGALLSSLALVWMPNASSLWMAAGLLWILDTAVNISMQPFRAFVADCLPAHQHTLAFSLQSFFIGLGSVSAAIAPWYLHNVIHLENVTLSGNGVPSTVKISFYIGAAFFLGTVLWTILTTTETPPEQPKRINSPLTPAQTVRHIGKLIRAMPITMRQLAGVQFCSWFGLFCLFLYFPPAIAHNIFGATPENTELYTAGIEWAGIAIALYNGVCLVFSLILPRLCEIHSRKTLYSFCLLCGGVGIVSLLFVETPYGIFLPMVGLGISWSSILSIPYAILAESLSPAHVGFYMGIFNTFIVIPQIAVALGLGWLMTHGLNSNPLLAVVLGGSCLILAALLVPSISDPVDEQEPDYELVGRPLES
ncbi:MAG: MFS transporter [Cyanobacteria bacterium P01_H01_bin.15]